MDGLPSTNFGRRALSYSLEGLSARDEMLFKSLVRLLDHLTVQKWVCRPASPDYRVDLLVVAEWYPPTVFRGSHSLRQPILSIGKGVDRELYLSWPVQPLRLQAELNRIGSTGAVHQSHDAQAPFVPMQASSDEDGLQLLRLKQWPPSQFLVGVGRMRLATLLTGRAMTMQELQQRSSLHISVCRAFISDLKKAQLLVITADDRPRPAAVLEPHQILNLPSSAVAFAKPGLLDRIRTGLGIKNSHSA